MKPSDIRLLHLGSPLAGVQKETPSPSASDMSSAYEEMRANVPENDVHDRTLNDRIHMRMTADSPPSQPGRSSAKSFSSVMCTVVLSTEGPVGAGVGEVSRSSRRIGEGERFFSGPPSLFFPRDFVAIVVSRLLAF